MGFPRQRTRRVEATGATARHHELAVAAPRACHAVGIGERQEPAGRRRSRIRAAARDPRPPLGEAAHIRGAPAPIATKPLDPRIEVDVVAAEAAFHQHGGEIGSGPGLAGLGCDRHHPREARRQRQGAQARTRLRQPPVRIEGAQFGQQATGLRQRGRRRRVQESELVGIGDAPGGAIEEQARQIRRQDLGPRERFEGVGGGLRPKPPADARLGAAGAAPPLIHRGPGGARRHEPGQAETGLIDRHPGEAGIDHDPDPLDGQRGLGDAGGQHHLAGPGRRRGDGPILLGRREGAVERRQHHAGSRRSASRSAVRRISACPGRNTSTEPGSARRARSVTSATASSIRRFGSRST